MRVVKKKVVEEEQNTNFMFSNFFPKIVPVMRYVAKYGTARLAT
jgi:hypothetical protein